MTDIEGYKKKKYIYIYIVFERWHRKLSHNWATRTKGQNKSTTICKLHGYIIHKYFLPKKSTTVGCVICSHSCSDHITILDHGSLCPRIKCFFILPHFWLMHLLLCLHRIFPCLILPMHGTFHLIGYTCVWSCAVHSTRWQWVVI